MQQGSLGHDVISLLVFGGTVFVSQIQTTAIYMYIYICMFLYSLIDEREISKNLYAVGLPDRLINIQ